MAIVGDAWIKIHAITDGLQKDIQKSLESSNKSAREAGAQAGKEYGAGFSEGREKSDSGGDGRWAGARARVADVGRRLRTEERGSIGSGGVPSPSVGSAVGSARNAAENANVDAIRSGGKKAEAAAGDAGDKAGKSFWSKLSGSANSGGGRAMGHFGSRLLILAPLIAVLVSAVSTLVSGLFALGSAIAPVTGGLAMLPGLAMAAAGAFIALKLAFGGIGQAVTAGLEAQKTATLSNLQNSNSMLDAQHAVKMAIQGVANQALQAAEAVMMSNRQIGDSVRQLKNELTDAAETKIQNSRSLVLSDRNLDDALYAQTRAEKGLKQARVDNLNQLIAMKFAVEDGALAERRASITIEKARRQLVLMSHLAPNNLLRMEAQLAFDEAMQHAKEQKQSNIEAGQAQDKAVALGVDGTRTIVDAKRQEELAARAVADAQFDAVRTRVAYAKTERDLAIQIMMAQRAVGDSFRDQTKMIRENSQSAEAAQWALASALRNLAITTINTSPAFSAFHKMMAKLPPSAQHFVKYLMGMQDKIMELKTAAADGILPKVEKSLDKLISSGVFDLFVKGIGGMSTVVGDLILSLSNMLSTPFMKGVLTDVMKDNEKVAKNMGGAFNNLVIWFLEVAKAAGPMTIEFSKWIKTITGNWADSAGSEAGQARLRTFFDKTTEVAKTLGEIIGNIAEGIHELGLAATPGGDSLLESFKNATAVFADLTGGTESVYVGMGKISTVKNEKFKTFFSEIADNVRAIGDLFNALFVALAKLGDDPGIKALSDSLRTRLLPELEKLMKYFNDKLAPGIAEILGAVAEAINNVDSPAFGIFVDLLVTFFNVISNITKNPAGKLLLQTILSIALGMKAIQIMGKVSGATAVIGASKKLNKYVIGKGSIKNEAGEVTKMGRSIGSYTRAGIKKTLKPVGSLLKKTGVGGFKAAGAAGIGIKKAGGGIATRIRNLKNNDTGAIANPLAKLQPAVIKAQDAVANAAKATAAWAGHAAKSAGSALKASGAWVASHVKSGAHAVSGAAKATAAWAGHATQSAAQAVKAGAAWALSHAKSATQAVASAIKATAAWVAHGVSSMASLIALNVVKVASAVATGAMTAAQWLLNAAMTANPIGLIIAAVVALVAAIVWIATKTTWFQDLWKAVWSRIEKPVKAIWEWIKKNWPMLLAILTGPIGLAVLLIVKNWDRIKGAFSAVWDWVRTTFTAGWGRIQGMLSGPIDAARELIANIIGKDNKSGIRGIFQRGVDAVGTIWSGLQALARVPIRFIIDTVINGGLIRAFNWVAERFTGVKQTIPNLSIPGLARGGILPGSSSYRDGDDQLVGMRRGEGVTVSEAMRSPYERNRLLALNRAALSGADISYFQGKHANEEYAGGGVVGKNGYWLGGIVDWAKNIGSNIASAVGDVYQMVKDPKKALKTIIDKAIALGGSALSSPIGKIVSSMPTKALTFVIEKIRSLFGAESAPGSTSGASAPVGAMQDMLVGFGKLLQSRGFQVNEHPAFGGVTRNAHIEGSKHYIGHAIDVNHDGMGQAAETAAINTIMGMSKLYKLNNIWQSPGHFDHAHFDYDQGGLLMPGLSSVYNGTGKPETVTPPGAGMFNGRVDSDGLTKGDRAVIAAIKAHQQAPASIIINPPPGTDVYTLAKLVSRELGFQMGR